MDKEEYIKRLKDCNVWFDFAKNQKKVADSILYKCMLQKDVLLQESVDDKSNDLFTLWSNAHFHYGIAIENGLKGLIIKYQQDKINFEIKGNNVILKNIGGNPGKSHNLLRLAEISKIFDSNLYKYESNYKSLKSVLLHLSEMIKWGARYPIPNNLDSIYRFDNAVPAVLVYGFHILDVMQPLFEHFENERIEY
jgi:hypothetical protein